jgi:hypothetical protein
MTNPIHFILVHELALFGLCHDSVYLSRPQHNKKDTVKGKVTGKTVPNAYDTVTMHHAVYKFKVKR